MRWSEERISHLAHKIYADLWRADLIDVSDEGRALGALKQALAKVVAVEDEIDTLVRDKLGRQKKIVGTHDWQILYERYRREELEKRGWS